MKSRKTCFLPNSQSKFWNFTFKVVVLFFPTISAKLWRSPRAQFLCYIYRMYMPRHCFGVHQNNITPGQGTQIRAKYLFLKNKTVLLEEKSILVGHILILPLPIPAAACLCRVPIPHNQACWCPRQALCFTAFFHPHNHQWNNGAPWFWRNGGCGLGILCLVLNSKTEENLPLRLGWAPSQHITERPCLSQFRAY